MSYLFFITPLILILSIFFTMVGIGGGVLYTPIQVFAGIPFNSAASNSLFLIMVSSLSAALIYRKEKILDSFIILIFSLATFAGSFSGGFFSKFFNETALQILFIIILLYNSISIIRKNRLESGKAKKTRFSVTRNSGSETFHINIPIALSGSFFAGFFGGLLGIGGGIFIIPLMILALKIPPKTAFANSSIIIGITGFGGFLGRSFNFPPDWKSAVIFALAALIGARTGAKFSLKTDSKKLQTYLGIFLFMIALAMIFKILRVYL